MPTVGFEPTLRATSRPRFTQTKLSWLNHIYTLNYKKVMIVENKVLLVEDFLEFVTNLSVEYPDAYLLRCIGESWLYVKV
uniref:Uncharacterized protein n=1 Tax=viral metagenome TaxID=1070528 RepID=A0A6M3M3B9_9ZZZZ